FRSREMKMIIRGAILAVVLSMAIVRTAVAGPFEDAVAAYGRGDFATAIGLFRPLADRGLVSAQFNLGVMYDNGQGVPQNDAEALRWYRLAAEQGHATAQNNVGFMYATGRGVPQDYADA